MKNYNWGPNYLTTRHSLGFNNGNFPLVRYFQRGGLKGFISKEE